MEAIVCDNFLKTTERAHASTKLTLRPGCSWSDIEFSEKPNEAGWDCLACLPERIMCTSAGRQRWHGFFPQAQLSPCAVWDCAWWKQGLLSDTLSCCEFLLVPWVLQFRTLLVWSYLSDGVGIWCGRNRVRDLLRHNNFFTCICAVPSNQI